MNNLNCQIMNSITVLPLLLVCILAYNIQAQSYAPAPGVPGSTAMYKDSSAFIDWAISATISRGPLDIENPGLGNVTYGFDSDALGFPDGINVVSLGDGGEAIITFQVPIRNGAGPDFAVFENGFIDHYMEFAFVEVSSDGINYFRFDAVSEAPYIQQQTNFSISNCAYINNLGGKYRQNYGTPFDLEELNGIPDLDVNAITHIKLIDVVGDINPVYATYDSQNNIINDPYPTAFESGGFDLDAVGVIHSATQGAEENEYTNFLFYPNPSKGVFECKFEGSINYNIHNVAGEVLKEGRAVDLLTLDMTTFPNGIYFVQLSIQNEFHRLKLIKNE